MAGQQLVVWARIIAVVVLAASAAIIIGWAADLPQLGRLYLDTPAMRPGTALGLAAEAAGLLTCRRRAGAVMSAFAMLVAGSVLLEAAGGPAWSPYQLMQRAGLTSPELAANSPEPPALAALLVLSLAAATLLLSVPPRETAIAARLGTVALVGACGALFVRAGGVAPLGSTSFVSATGIGATALLAVAVLFATAPTHGIVNALFVAPGLRSRLLRNFVLPIPAVLVPAAVFLLVLLDRRGVEPSVIRTVAQLAITAVLVLTSAAFLGGRRIADRVARDVTDLRTTAGRIASGDLDTRVPRRARDELAEVVDEFETMRQALAEREVQDRLVSSAVQVAAAAPDLHAALEALGGLVAEILPFDRWSWATADDAPGGGLVCVATAGPGDWLLPADAQLPFPAADVHLLHEGQTVAVEIAAQHFVAVPIVTAGAMTAVVIASTARTDVALSPSDIRVVEEIAHRAASVLGALRALVSERAANERLRQLDQLKNEFVGIVAHDLRSPMTVISGYAETIRSGWSVLSDEQKMEYLDTISRNVRNLAQLVEDVLQVARIESGDFPYDVRPLDLGDYVRQVVEDFSISHPDRVITVSGAGRLPKVAADPDRLHRVLVNLVGNALKFSAAQLPVEVCIDTGDGLLRVSVTDHGPGIPEDEQHLLFTKFSRLSTGRAVKGTGLGLYICRSLIEAMGGAVGVSTEVGRGSTFWFTLPQADEPALAHDPS